MYLINNAEFHVNELLILISTTHLGDVDILF